MHVLAHTLIFMFWVWILTAQCISIEVLLYFGYTLLVGKYMYMCMPLLQVSKASVWINIDGGPPTSPTLLQATISPLYETNPVLIPAYNTRAHTLTYLG